jgi:predicted nucleic-acid-binding Zn-ribbon protein
MADSAEAGGCSKCGETDTDVVSMTTDDGIVGKVVDLPDEGFMIDSCEACGYSELYRRGSSESDPPRDLFLA